MSYGWLPYNPAIKREESWFGMELDPGLPTRWEEYTFVRNTLRESLPVNYARLLDAACGYTPKVHIMAEIAARDGWQVEAMDIRPPQPGYEDHGCINRVEGNITDMGYADASFDAVICISSLEHISVMGKLKATIELWRVLKPGGLVVFTMDAQEPWGFVDIFGKSMFDFGEKEEWTGSIGLEPHVSYLTGVKR